MAENKLGRPTDYKPEYCELLIEHMRQGLSFESFAGKVEASKQTIYDWMDRNPDFLDARRKGDALSLLFWENEGKEGMWSGKMFNAAVWIINMKNRHQWRDRVEVSSDQEKPLSITLNYERKKKSMMLINNDCLKALKELEADSIDSLVTDPPAGISFMGKEWDSDKGGRDGWIAWMTEVMQECHRVMKPGAHGLVWAIPRTSHWTATALENAGFEIRDVVTHLFGQGFPKSLDISKAIDKAAGAERERGPMKRGGERLARLDDGNRDGKGTWKDEVNRNPYTSIPSTDSAKQWQGWGTALKPASEHWILIRKPISEKTVAANVLKHGTGGINIDASRIGTNAGWNYPKGRGGKGCFGIESLEVNLSVPMTATQGRFPANLVLSHSLHCTDDQCDIECAIKALDEQSGILKQGVAGKKSRAFGNGETYGTAKEFKPNGTETYACDKPSGASRFFYCAKISSSERNAGLDGFPDKVISVWGGEDDDLSDGKKSTIPKKNTHPTVKPKKLMSYFIKMITPQEGTVLDPFMGSGSTGIAAKETGFNFIGIEHEPEYFEIATKRING